MNVTVKSFDVVMELKNKGIELEVRSPQGDHLGDLIITKTQAIWCKGRTRRENGKSVTLEQLAVLITDNG